MSYMFYYSERPGTLAERKYEDDIPLSIKKRRLSEIVKKQMACSLVHNQNDIGQVFKVLIDGTSKKSELDFKGRNSQNKVVVFQKKEGLGVGDYVQVKINNVTSATLLGEVV